MLCLLFNLGGYRFLIGALQTKADEKLEAAIDSRQYNESELVEIRVALNMPYQERYTEFERHYGQINLDGKVYNYVKRKIEGGVLVLKCIPNHSQQQLVETAHEITKSIAGQDQDNSSKKQTSSLLKSAGSDYDDNLVYFLPLFAFINKATFSASSDALHDVLITIPHQPPRTLPVLS